MAGRSSAARRPRNPGTARAREAEVIPLRAPAAPTSLSIGRLESIGDDGVPLVRVGDALRAARAVIDLRRTPAGAEVALGFEGGDPARPIVLGVLSQPAPREVEAVVDGDRVVLDGRREIVLRCGEASITLTRAGKIVLRGAYIVTRSTGCNKIQGASVRIN
jgi:hypothetical protein